MNEPLLQVRDLHTTFHSKGVLTRAVRGVTFEVGDDEILGIVGESGSGKSVLMKSVLGILPGNAECTGEVAYGGRNLLELSPRERRATQGAELSMIFQDPMTALNPVKSVGSQMVEVIRRHLGLSRTEARGKAIHLLDQVGIPSPEQRLKQYPHEFSGGMRQRVLIAMALACNSRLLIADEPTTALDVTIQAQILELLKSLQAERDLAIILITHDMGIVASMCDRLMVMYGGLSMEQAPTWTIFYRPRHPYTQALLAAIPRIDNLGKERLVPIPGRAPSLVDPPPGCPFAPRCQHATDRCREELPELREVGPQQLIRCHFDIEGAAHE